MDNGTGFDGSPFTLNNTDTHNNSLPSQIPSWTIITVSLSGIGILANVLVIFVIMLSFLRNSVFMNLIMSLAIFDIVYLLADIDNKRGIFGEVLIKPSLVYCRFNKYFIYVSGILSSWLTVFISLERYIAIFYPFKVHVYCTKKRMVISVIILTILTCLTLVPLFYTCSVIFIDQMPKCISIGSGTWSDITFISFLLTIYNIIPLIFISILNVLILRKIQVQNALRANLQGQQCRPTSSTNNTSLVTMMVCVCVIFGVTSLPATVILIVNYTCTFTTRNHCVPIEGWLYRFAFTLENVNHSVNFFLYCLTGSVFRRALFQLFKCKIDKHSEGHLPGQRSIEQNVVSNVRNYSHSRV